MQPCDLLKAMADESRLRLLVVLAEEELCVRQLEAVLQLSQSNVSRHLEKLRAAGLVTARKADRHVFYRLSDSFPEAWPGLFQFLCSLRSAEGCQVDLHSLAALKNESQVPAAQSTRRHWLDHELI